jgi:peptidoglycan/xylan/chitin deacetylase (PgdA/CDA1 family)
MDNLGEAQEVNRGLWPPGKPVGSHPSVLDQLPRMLHLLDTYGVKATYFAESWSLNVYSDVVKDMLSRGHEIAWHGYQHETWSSLSEDEEIENFQKSWEHAKDFGIKYRGFRPPGGSVNERTYDLLHKHCVRYVSPLGQAHGTEHGIIVLPFDWKCVDAFYYMEKFAGIRKSYGEQGEVLSPSDFKAFVLEKISTVCDKGGYISILFHPFLQTSDEKLAVMNDVLNSISNNPAIWCAPCDEVAKWLIKNPELLDT